MVDSSEPVNGVVPLLPARTRGRGPLATLLAAQSSTRVTTPDFEVDRLDRCARFPDGEEVRFTPRQWRLLEVFIGCAGHPVTVDALAAELFAEDAPEEARHVPVLILQLRRKLEPEVEAPRYIRSLDARTYIFDPLRGIDPRRDL